MDPRVMLGEEDAYSRIFDQNGQWTGIYWWHKCSANEAPGLHGDGLTPSWIPFDTPAGREMTAGLGPIWPVVSFYPLTLGGSLLCNCCQRHGFIRNDRWEPA